MAEKMVGIDRRFRVALVWFAAAGMVCGCGDPAPTADVLAADAAAGTDVGQAANDVVATTDSPAAVDGDATAPDTSAAADSSPAADAAPGDSPPASAPDAALAEASPPDATSAPTDTAPPKCPADCPKPASVCLYAVCDPGLGCVFAAVTDAVLCDDGKPCTQGSVCAAGVCQSGAATTCNDANACTADSCDPNTGACANVPTPGAPVCDDNDPCTVDTTCAAGQCAGGVAICACKASADCAAKEDGNLCNGTLYCDSASHACVVNPATVVACSDDGKPCTASVCAPGNGKCQSVNLPTTATCSDGLACTQGDHCAAGTCTPGTNICCTGDGDCAAAEDGDACNGTLFCNKATGKCQLNPKTIVNCASSGDTACQKHLCDKKLGSCNAVAIAEGGACDDGNPCTQSACTKGACKSGTNTCACQKDADCATQEGGNLCNGTLFCHLASNTCKVNPATIVACNTNLDGACATATCNPQTGTCALQAKNAGQPCEADGNACTGVDTCDKGLCKPGPALCQCQSNGDCLAQDDGNPCNGTLYCDQIANTCKVNPATVVACASANDTACAVHQCNPQTAKCEAVAVNEFGACEADGNPCTSGDSCAAGACSKSQNVCQCQSDKDCAPLDDGDACNGKLYCDNSVGACLVNPATVVACPTVNDSACAHSVCQAKSGLCQLVAFNEFGTCDADGNPCTIGDRCQAGACLAGLNQCQCGVDQNCGVFDDSNTCNGILVCTGQDNPKAIGLCAPATNTVVVCPSGGVCVGLLCDPASGKCLPKPINDNKNCDDGLACTAADLCKNGTCVGTQPGCDDNEPCTVDLCDPAAKTCTHAPTPCGDSNPCTADSCKKGEGCSHEKLPGACDDGNLCTLGDGCADGKCVSGKDGQDCDDGLGCTADACSPLAGCVHQAQSGPCSDGNPCTIGDACKQGACLATEALDCSDGNPCTADPCKSGLGCVHTAQDATCTDGNPCSTGDSCAGGKCSGTAEVDCGDANPCTADACIPGKGCVHTAQVVGCDDSNPCTAGDTCKGTACLPGAQTVSCNDGNPCTLDSCSSVKGCVAQAVSGPCNDGNACTSGDGCQQGGCVGSKLVDCGDGNPCSKDDCAQGSGCVNLPAVASCSDGNPCTQGDQCLGGSCKAGAAVDCDDQDFCTNDACTSAKGCVHVFNVGPCDDGQFCTVADTCDGQGSCVGKIRDCQAEVGSACTVGKCDEAANKCTPIALADGTGCDDDVDCTPLDLCKAGKCEGKGDVCGDEALTGAGEVDRTPGLAALPNNGYAVQWSKQPSATWLRSVDGNGSRLNEPLRLDATQSLVQGANRPFVSANGTLLAASANVGYTNSSVASNPSSLGTVTLHGISPLNAVTNLGALTGTATIPVGSYSGHEVRARLVQTAAGKVWLCAAFHSAIGGIPQAPARELACAPIGLDGKLGAKVPVEFAPMLAQFEVATAPSAPAELWLTYGGPVGLGSPGVANFRFDPATGKATASMETSKSENVKVCATIVHANGSTISLFTAGSSGELHFGGGGAGNTMQFYSIGGNGLGKGGCDMVELDGGTILVVYASPNADGSGWGIVGQTTQWQSPTVFSSLWVINSQTVGDQVDPSLVRLTNGDYVVAYRDGAGIAYTRRFNAAHKPTGVRLERVANTTTLLDQNQLTAAATPEGGRAMLAWTSFVAGLDGQEIRARVVDHNGKPVTGEFGLNKTTVDNQSSPAVAAGVARFVAVWNSYGQDGSQDGIVGRVFDSDGQALTGEVAVNEGTNGAQHSPAVAMLGNGHWMAAWQFPNPPVPTLRGRVFDKSGKALTSTDITILNQPGGALVNPSVVALEQSQEFLVIWDQSLPGVSKGWDILMCKFSAQGQATTGVMPFMGAAFDQRFSHAAASGTTVLACYQEQPTTAWRLYCNPIDLTTLAVGATQPQVGQVPGNHTAPLVVGVPGGTFQLAWQNDQLDGSGLAVQFAALDGKGAQTGPRVQANRTLAGNQSAPVAAWLQGGTLVAWVGEGQDGSGTGIVYRVLPQ